VSQKPALHQVTTSKGPEKHLLEGKKCQGTTSQAAEKLIRAVGPGFIPDINPAE
jgi:hypothetical protein